MGHGTLSRRVCGIVLAATLAGSGGCARADDPASYREAAVASLEAVLGDSRTAELAGRQWLLGRSTHAFTSVVVGESETGLGAESSWFEALQPPTRAGDAVREVTLDAVDGAASAVQSVRIAVERDDRRAARAALDVLRARSATVESLAEDLR